MNKHKADNVPMPQKAQAQDMAEILQLYKACVQSGKSYWDEEYPNQEVVEADVAAQELFLWRNGGELLGTVSLLKFDEVEELGLPFRFTQNPCVLCRLCVSPTAQGKGLGRKLLDSAQWLAATLGYRAIHLLCDHRHEVAQRLYKSAGYTVVSEVTLYELFFTVFEKSLMEV